MTAAPRRRRRSRGQALVEFAFVFPLIIFVAFAFIDIGRAVFNFNTLTNAAREAARVAIVNQVDPALAPWSCAANKPVENPVSPNWTFRGCAMTAGSAIGVGSADVTVAYSAPPGTTLNCPASGPPIVGCIVTVTVVNDYSPITPLAGALIGSVTFSATSAMPVERVFP
jgi:Flp pilus assembly protein TadG